jgi:hypothetical protein
MYDASSGWRVVTTAADRSFLANTAVALISSLFQNTSSTRYGQMSFTSITTLTALGIRVKTAA